VNLNARDAPLVKAERAIAPPQPHRRKTLPISKAVLLWRFPVFSGFLPCFFKTASLKLDRRFEGAFRPVSICPCHAKRRE
jgi:hypothetical protein